MTPSNSPKNSIQKLHRKPPRASRIGSSPKDSQRAASTETTALKNTARRGGTLRDLTTFPDKTSRKNPTFGVTLGNFLLLIWKEMWDNSDNIGQLDGNPPSHLFFQWKNTGNAFLSMRPHQKFPRMAVCSEATMLFPTAKDLQRRLQIYKGFGWFRWPGAVGSFKKYHPFLFKPFSSPGNVFKLAMAFCFIATNLEKKVSSCNTVPLTCHFPYFQLKQSKGGPCHGCSTWRNSWTSARCTWGIDASSFHGLAEAIGSVMLN